MAVLIGLANHTSMANPATNASCSAATQLSGVAPSCVCSAGHQTLVGVQWRAVLEQNFQDPQNINKFWGALSKGCWRSPPHPLERPALGQ